MSRLKGEQLYEIMGKLPDDLVTEALPLTLLGGVAAAGADTLFRIPSEPAPTPTRMGFGAWLKGGGWIPVAAGVLVAAGVAVGAFFFGKSGDQPPVGSDPTIEETTPQDSEESTDAATEAETPEETADETADESADETESETNSETESETSAETQDETVNDIDPSIEAELRITSFLPAEDFLPLFTATQCRASVNEDGTLSARGYYGAQVQAASTVAFPVRELMKLSPDYDPNRTFHPHGILIKFTRENCSFNAPTASVNVAGQGDGNGVPSQHYYSEDAEYEYLLITVGNHEGYLSGELTDVVFHWVYESMNISTNRAVTIHEIAFYSNHTAAMKGLGALLQEDEAEGSDYDFSVRNSAGVVLSGPMNALGPGAVITLPASAPDGTPVVAIGRYGFRQNQVIHSVTVPEGILKIEEEAFYHCHNLATVYLPDSLRIINESAFDYCTILTEVHLGSGIQYIGENAFHFSLRDIYYKGTMEDWSRVVIAPTQTGWLGQATVHCTDGDIPAKQTASVQKPVEAPDLSALLAMAEPIPLQEGQTVSRVEATPLTVYDEEGYSSMEVILRWAIIEDASHLKGLYYYFDILSPEDGRILRAMPLSAASAYPCLQNSAMILIDTDVMGFDPSILFISYSYYEGNGGNSTLNLMSRGYSLTVNEEGGISLRNWNNNEGSIGLTNAETPLEPRKLKILSTLATKLAERDYPARVLISTNPVQERAFYSIADAPVITREHAEALAAITHKEFTELGFDGIYDKYGLCKAP